MKKIFILVLWTLLLSGCVYSKSEKDVFSMDTHITMTAYGKNADNVLDIAEAEIKRLDKKFAQTDTNTVLESSDSELLELFNKAGEVNQKTKGAFNIHIAPIMRAWGFYSEEFGRKEYKVPTNDELLSAMEKMKTKSEIDFGAIAKGYCADRVVELLKKNGIEKAVISLGGNVATVGKNENGKPWTVGIQSPFDDGLYATIKVSDMAVVTSGDYVRFFEKDQKKYHHIIDPQTGYPADSGLSSVTIISKSSTTADALSTAFFVMGKDGAINYWEKDKTFDMVLIERSGKIYYTDGIEIDTKYEKEIIKK